MAGGEFSKKKKPDELSRNVHFFGYNPYILSKGLFHAFWE